ncbi:MAG: hypothetical protein ACM3U2_15275 [Deltaproteobacteria bacterium]
MIRQQLWNSTKHRKYRAERWAHVLKALKEVGVVGIDPAGVHFLTETAGQT